MSFSRLDPDAPEVAQTRLFPRKKSRCRSPDSEEESQKKEVAQNQVFPREYLILSNVGILVGIRGIIDYFLGNT